jgi:hypothetical protein
MVFGGAQEMTRWQWVWLVGFWAGCVQFPEKPVSLEERQPQVLYIIPDGGEPISGDSQFLIFFSRPLDSSSLQAEAITILPGEVSLEALEEHKDSEKVPLSIQLAENPYLLIAQTEQPLQVGENYSLVVTSHLLSEDKVPVRPYLKLYQTSLNVDSEIEGSIETEGSRGQSGGAESRSGSTQATDETAEGAEPSVTPSPSAEGGEGSVVINELFYDAVGSDTDGVLFVELFGTPQLSLAGYQILFLNGEGGAVTDSITLPEGSKVPSDGFYLIADSRSNDPATSQVNGADLIDNFDPQNGPESVQLKDSDGNLVDVVGYGEGLRSVSEEGLALFESSAAPDVASGHSLERVSPGQDTDNNAADFVERETPTPGH